MGKTLSLAGRMSLLFAAGALYAANPYLPLWEHVPDGEPYVFDDPDSPGRKRVYIYGSHDSQRTLPCGREHVLWSAPVEDLNRWRFDGVIFRSLDDANGRPLDRSWLGDQLYAPDVALKIGADGKKTYFLIPNNMARKRKSMIAMADRPDGPFKVCNWSAKDPTRTEGCLGSDPAVFVDDDGRVYGYWGFWRSMAAELDPRTMATLKPGTKVVEDMVSGAKQPGVFRFYEASSLRKVKDKYVFIYSRWTEEGEFGLKGAPYTLAYAYSDRPLGPWTYGGTLIDARARETRPGGKTVVTASPWGNTHGSICEINGRWYVFYHRQCGLQGLSRQAMVAPITVEVEEGAGGKVRISEAEYTSEGFETDGLDPLEWHPAGITCHYVGGPYVRPWHADGYGAADPYDEKINRSSVVNILSGSVVGYKYFNFGKTHGCKSMRLEMKLLPLGEKAKMEVWAVRPNAAEGGIKVGEVTFSGDEEMRTTVRTVDVAPLAAVEGRKALFFVFHAERKGRPICEMESFRFICAAERNPVSTACAAAAANAADAAYDWIDAATLDLDGRGFPSREEPFVRLPKPQRELAPQSVRAMSRESTGLNFRFKTTSRKLVFRYETEKRTWADPLVPPSGLQSVSLWGRWKSGAEWEFIGKNHPNAEGNNEYAVGWNPDRTGWLYLPMRAVVKTFKIGVEKGNSFEVVPCANSGKVVVYGTSIVHGGCVSSAGMMFTSFMGRRLDRNVIALGFSGAGKMELEMAELLAGIDASIYVIDCDWNMTVEMQKDRYEPFVRRLRDLRPSVPILLCGGCTEAKEPRRQEVFAKSVFDRLKAEDAILWGRLHFLSGVDTLPKCSWATHDHCHPNDYGAPFMGEAYARRIGGILEQAR